MGKREVVEGRNRNARKVRRQQLGKLKDLIVQPRTRVRYEHAMQRFFEFLRWNKIALPSRWDEADSVASSYVEELWEEGDSRSLAQDTISALQHFEPQLKRKMLRSWRLLKAWQKHEIPTRAPPFTLTTLSVLAGWLQTRCAELALAVCVGFHALLRSGELCQLRNRNIICSEDLVILQLGQTKMAVRNAGVESASFRHQKISIMLRAWKAVNSDEALLVNMSPSLFRQWFSRGLSETGLISLPYKPYSLRRGGATQVFLETQSYAAVCQRGRWASERTSRIYIQDSISLLTDIPKALTSVQREFYDSWNELLGRLEPPSSRAGRSRGRGRGK